MKIENLKLGDYYIHTKFGVCKYTGTDTIKEKLYYLFLFKSKQKRYLIKEQVNSCIYFYMDKEEGDEKGIKLDSLWSNKSWKRKKREELKRN
ncbi:CarD family transcriptional regulator [Clostridium sp. JN-1]|uniref:CarD family transcriptional regulator n=1 Tax=Clostridium sp. JN-1 TaxID=2483110 RepID=UPI000F0BA700|nr:CarD family transcriptional regulator [Clostridium sp. JN-1]